MSKGEKISPTMQGRGSGKSFNTSAKIKIFALCNTRYLLPYARKGGRK